MAITRLGKLAEAQTKFNSNSLAIPNTSGAVIPAGTVLEMVVAYDNAASATSPTVSPSDSGGAAWIAGAGPIGSGVTTTAGAGIFLRTFRVKTVSDIAAGATVTTITWGSPVAGKAITIVGYAGATTTLRGTVVTGTSTSGAPSVVSGGTALVAGDLVIGAVGGEAAAVPTGDADTLNGSWSTMAGISTSGGQAATNVASGIQDKIVTATGAQTFNATTALDSVAAIYALVPVAAPTAPTSAPTVAAGADKVTVTTPATLQGGADSYEIRKGGVLIASGRGANTAFDDTAASVLTTQTYTVRGVNVAGTSSDSPASSAVAANPGPPTFGLLGTGAGEITVNVNRKSYAAVYKIYRGPTGGSRVLVHTSASQVADGTYQWVDSGLTAGSIYDYHVVTSVSAPTSRDSAASTVLPKEASLEPEILYPNSDISSSAWASTLGSHWSAINEHRADYDLDYSSTSFGSVLRVGLTNPVQTQNAYSSVDIYVGYRATNVSNIVNLLQGGSIKAQFFTSDLTGQFTEEIFTLTQPQVASITDWTDLELSFQMLGVDGTDSFTIEYVNVDVSVGTPPDPGGQPTWSMWNGTTEVPLTLSGVWDGSAIDPVGAVEIAP